MIWVIATEHASGRMPGMEMLIMLFLFLGMWFILIAPQKKKQKKHEEMINALAKGDKVLTMAGIFGEICDVKPDRFAVKVSEHTTLEVHRSCITTKL
ncbi:MAG: preprotein translocase subunit YajC [Puniceicoccales bacterium]|jgi:preprotein translocase subunit YajC|nr:preprotein translocase subunit YajC [Puniceicoccales bacterium]